METLYGFFLFAFMLIATIALDAAAAALFTIIKYMLE